ncbi:MAG TPA: aminotransferase class I/II-fold pyridoxal phosphate-dependent enzyme [Pirellulales bacterium]|jgi:cystathionine beta-lyase/cystathionine gamma-synthase
MPTTDDLCPRPLSLPPGTDATKPLAAPITLATVWQCENPNQAEGLLAGKLPGYIYSRDRHPNADLLAEKCRLLHGAERAAVTASGMAAMALAVVSQCIAGDHVVVSNRLYGKSLYYLTSEAARLGITSTVVDVNDLPATAAAMKPNTKLVVVETITNPTLRVADVGALAKIVHEQRALLLVDNTFASPAIFRPLEFGADLVLESLTKIMNGHSDALLGLLCGGEKLWPRVVQASSAWGFMAAPFECWLVERGLGTLHLRIDRASANAAAAAEFLAKQKAVTRIDYPGLKSHPDYDLAARQFGGKFGAMVTFTLAGGTAAAEKFIAAAKRIPFCPSLGELSTTLSHPDSTSHRLMTAKEREALGIFGGTIRLSIGTESPEFVIDALAEGLRWA